MKYDNNRLTTMKQLEIRKQKGKKEVIWRLNQEQIKAVQKCYRIEEWLYSVSTRKSANLRGTAPLLKELHYRYKRGAKSVVMKLTENDKKILSECGIKYQPFKFKIYLKE